MARPIKQGLDYFPLDVGLLQDIKIRKMMRSQKDSIAVLIALLCNIYRDEGYYMGFDDDECFLISEDAGVSVGAVQSVVNKALQVGFFDEILFQEHKILTSVGIQKRFFEAVSRRKEVYYDDLFILVSVNDYNNLVNVNNNPQNVGDNQQSKVKESKVKESKENIISDTVSVDNLFQKYGFSVDSNFIDDLSIYDLKWIEDAIAIAVEKGIKNPSYVKAILNNWKTNGRNDTKKTKFHNFVGQTEEHTDEELNQIALNKNKGVKP